MSASLAIGRCAADGRLRLVSDSDDVLRRARPPRPVGIARGPTVEAEELGVWWVVGVSPGLVALTAVTELAIAQYRPIRVSTRDRLGLGRRVARYLSPPSTVVLVSDPSSGLLFCALEKHIAQRLAVQMRHRARREEWWPDELA